MEVRGLMRGREAAEPALHPWRDILIFAALALSVAGAVALLGVGLHAIGAERDTASDMGLLLAAESGVLTDGRDNRCSNNDPNTPDKRP